MSNIPIRAAAFAGRLLLGLLLAVAGGWGVLALAYAGPGGDTLRYGLGGLFAVTALSALIALALRRCRIVIAYLVLFLVVLAWYLQLAPSNERDWQKDVAVLPYAEVAGDTVTVHNIRNFAYRSESDYTPA